MFSKGGKPKRERERERGDAEREGEQVREGEREIFGLVATSLFHVRRNRS